MTRVLVVNHLEGLEVTDRVVTTHDEAFDVWMTRAWRDVPERLRAVLERDPAKQRVLVALCRAAFRFGVKSAKTWKLEELALQTSSFRHVG